TTSSNPNTDPTGTSTTSSNPNTDPTGTSTTSSNPNTDPTETSTTSSNINTDPTETSTMPTTDFILGDVDDNGKINAEDASAVLEHAANIGAGLGGTLTDNLKKCADVDENGIVNAEDASQILAYAAAVGSGKTYEFQKADKSEIVDADPTAPTYW
ncbi:MAG: hypothetical protein K2H66_05430, partial [Oscillospiraceae bacterium]|nr:hypothetical protein [Oscillospiraceae bacterium]